MKINISGASDDLIEVMGDAPGCDEHGAAGDHDRESGFQLAGVFVVGNVRVRCLYDGCWSFAVGPLADGVVWPKHWKITIKVAERDYSSEICIDTGDDKVAVIRER